MLCLGIAVIGSNSLVLGPIAPQVAESLGRGTPAVMVASGAFGIGTALAAILLGRLIDRFGAGRMLRLALALFVLALAASAAAPALAVLVAAQFAAGLAAGVALPSIYTLAAVVAPAGRESDGRPYSLATNAHSAGSVERYRPIRVRIMPRVTRNWCRSRSNVARHDRSARARNS